MIEELYFRILGELEVLRGGERVRLAAGKLPVLLTTLLLRANHIVSVDELVDRLWGDTPPGRARGSLPTYVMRLRQALGDDAKAPRLIRTRASGYAIEIEPEQLDLLRFRKLVERAGEQDLHDALAIWPGEALTGIQSESLRQQELPRLVEERLRVLERRIDRDLELGRFAELTGELSELTARHPMRERFWGQRMHALYRSGRQADALTCYHAIRDRLVDELGVEPGSELRRMHDAILRNDSRLQSTQPPDHPTPRQLPADVTSFAGRDAALARLDTRVGARTVVISAIHGTAGVGKTALAVHWAHRASHLFPDGQLYLNLRGFDPDRPPVDPGDALGQFLRALGADQLPHDIEERAALFRTLVAAKRLLVLLDNAATVDQVRPLLPGSPSCVVLVTSRNQLTGLVAIDGAQDLTLDVLRPAEAMSLVENVIGRERARAEPGAATELTVLCGHLPLALRVAAGKLVMRPTQPLSDSVAELRDGARLGALEVDGDRRGAVRAAFDMSYLALKPDEQRLFRRLGLVPGPDFTPAAAEVLIGLPGQATARLLDRLVTGHLVERPTSQRFRLHDLLRHYARERCAADESTQDAEAAASRLYDWYLATAQAAVLLTHPHSPLLEDHSGIPQMFAGTAQAWAWLDAERANLTAAVDDALNRGQPAMALRLADTLRGYFIARTYFESDWQAVVHSGLRAAEQLDDDRARAAMYLNQAITHYALGDLPGYLDRCRQALEFATRAEWVKGTAKALTFLGQGHMELGILPEALEYLERSRAVLAETAPAELSYVYNIFGWTYLELGNLHEAIDYFGQALQIGRELDSLPDQTIALHGIGTAQQLLGKRAEAVGTFTECLRVSRALRHADREAISLSYLAELAVERGEQETLLAQALTALERARYPRVKVCVHNVAGRVCRELGRTRAAADHHRRALDDARQLGYRYDETEALLGLADAQHDDTLAGQALIMAQQSGFRVLAEQALGRSTTDHRQ